VINSVVGQMWIENCFDGSIGDRELFGGLDGM
jgi:hypothetical protein